MLVVADRGLRMGCVTAQRQGRDEDGDAQVSINAQRCAALESAARSEVNQGLPFTSKYNRRTSSGVSGFAPRRPMTAIWPPVSSTARSRSNPFDKLKAGFAVR